MKLFLSLLSLILISACSDDSKKEEQKTFQTPPPATTEEPAVEPTPSPSTPTESEAPAPAEQPNATNPPTVTSTEQTTTTQEPTPNDIQKLLAQEQNAIKKESYLLHVVANIDLKEQEDLPPKIVITTTRGISIPFTYTHKNIPGSLEYTSDSEIDRLTVQQMDSNKAVTIIRIYNTSVQNQMTLLKIKKTGNLILKNQWFQNQIIDEDLELSDDLKRNTFAAFQSFLEHVAIKTDAELTIYYVVQKSEIPSAANKVQIALGDIVRFNSDGIASSLAAQDNIIEVQETHFADYDFPRPRYSDIYGTYWHQPNVIKTAFSSDKEIFSNGIILDQNNFGSLLDKSNVKMIWYARPNLGNLNNAYEFPVEFEFK